MASYFRYPQKMKLKMNYFKISILLILFILGGADSYANSRLDSLLKVLDTTVERRSEYTEQKEQLIANLKHQLSYATADEQRFNLTGKLFYLYSNYRADSALYLAEKRMIMADKSSDLAMIAEAKMNMAEVFRTTGMYKESLDILDEIKAKGLDKFNRGYYLHLRHSLYILIAEYSISEEEKKKYNSLVFSYKDSILQITPKENIDFYLVGSTRNIMLGEYEKALSIMKEAYPLNLKNAMVCYTLAEIYRNLGDKEKEKIYLAESAIADLKSGVKEYISLQELAALLFKDGDIDRAYLYMMTSMQDAIFSNARMRTLEVARMLPLINETYNIKMAQERNRLFSVFVVTIILAVILLIALIYIYRQVKKLSSIRRYQKNMNTELKDVNNKLNLANSELTDANLIKEEYIGYLFNVCSSYIDKLENFRIEVNRKIKTGQIKELEKQTSSSSLVSDELKEFYKNFDIIFLNLYPTFVDDFNALLHENERIEPKDGDLLTPELRIFAIVRLGISDSVKIAEFLHYSPQTIYNYRLKIRNKLAIDKDDFPTELAKIGLL